MANKIAPRTRAQAIADLQAGEQPAIVAERYGLNRDTVKQWKQRHVVTMPVTESVTVSPRVTRPKLERQQAEIGALVLDLLAAKLEASAAIAEAVRDQAWLARQSASELAALGEWLDGSALAIGDRLAGRSQQGADAAPGE